MPVFGQFRGILSRVGQAVGRGLFAIGGRPNWDAPPWAKASGRGARRLGGWARARPAQALALLAALVLVAGGGTVFKRWWDKRPKPITVEITVVAPSLTRIEEKPRPYPVRVVFEKTAAPLD